MSTYLGVLEGGQGRSGMMPQRRGSSVKPGLSAPLKSPGCCFLTETYWRYQSSEPLSVGSGMSSHHLTGHLTSALPPVGYTQYGNILKCNAIIN